MYSGHPLMPTVLPLANENAMLLAECVNWLIGSSFDWTVMRICSLSFITSWWLKWPPRNNTITEKTYFTKFQSTNEEVIMIGHFHPS